MDGSTDPFDFLFRSAGLEGQEKDNDDDD